MMAWPKSFRRGVRSRGGSAEREALVKGDVFLRSIRPVAVGSTSFYNRENGCQVRDDLFPSDESIRGVAAGRRGGAAPNHARAHFRACSRLAFRPAAGCGGNPLRER